MRDAENHLVASTPCWSEPEVTFDTRCWIEVKTPSADSTPYRTATATNKMMKDTTDTAKLNFITDQGSTRAMVRWASLAADFRTVAFGGFGALGAFGFFGAVTAATAAATPAGRGNACVGGLAAGLAGGAAGAGGATGAVGALAALTGVNDGFGGSVPRLATYRAEALELEKSEGIGGDESSEPGAGHGSTGGGGVASSTDSVGDANLAEDQISSAGMAGPASSTLSGSGTCAENPGSSSTAGSAAGLLRAAARPLPLLAALRTDGLRADCPDVPALLAPEPAESALVPGS